MRLAGPVGVQVLLSCLSCPSFIPIALARHHPNANMGVGPSIAAITKTECYEYASVGGIIGACLGVVDINVKADCPYCSDGVKSGGLCCSATWF